MSDDGASNALDGWIWWHTQGEPPSPALSWGNVEIAALMLVFNVGVSTWLGLGLSGGLIVASIRCVVQLTALGFVLNQIFMTQNPVYIFGMALALGLLASAEVTFWRAKRTFPGMFPGTLAAIMGSALTVALLGNAYSLKMEPVYTAQKFIPTIGMLFGNCMIGVSIGLTSVMESLETHRDRAETVLCYGASRWEAIRPVARDALRAAMLPTITNMSITGLISIPGVMTGWILGGADVLQAARYQQIILFMITASSASSALLAVLFCASVLIDKTPALRLDRITVCTTSRTTANADERCSNKMRSAHSSRASLRYRANAGRLLRAKSELYSPTDSLLRLRSSATASPTISTDSSTEDQQLQQQQQREYCQSEQMALRGAPLLIRSDTSRSRSWLVDIEDTLQPLQPLRECTRRCASSMAASRRHSPDNSADSAAGQQQQPQQQQQLHRRPAVSASSRIKQIWDAESSWACAICPLRSNAMHGEDAVI
ncbi:hypothetical protein H4217_000629 [Coemansia sp. RSA 1939]|nr:hypothetical protein H4217_000629 [Coemansia sp. RSA 1939]KAJ2695407.1 hypothetical protein GGH99_000136 [Coemansia sp. RSA 1285]